MEAKDSSECCVCAALACPSALCREFQLASLESSTSWTGVGGVCTADANSELESAAVVVVLDALVADTAENVGDTSSILRSPDDLVSATSSVSSSSSLSSLESNFVGTFWASYSSCRFCCFAFARRFWNQFCLIVSSKQPTYCEFYIPQPGSVSSQSVWPIPS